MKYLLFLILASTLGCATVGTTVMKTYPPNPENCNLQVFSSPEEIKAKYEVIALLDARAGKGGTSADAIKSASPQACKCGGDAVLISGMGNTNHGWGDVRGSALIKVLKYTK